MGRNDWRVPRRKSTFSMSLKHERKESASLHASHFCEHSELPEAHLGGPEHVLVNLLRGDGWHSNTCENQPRGAERERGLGRVIIIISSGVAKEDSRAVSIPCSDSIGSARIVWMVLEGSQERKCWLDVKPLKREAWWKIFILLRTAEYWIFTFESFDSWW